MKILLLTRYGHLGASSRLRMLQYAPYLRSRGVDVDVRALFSDEYLRCLYARGQRKLSAVAYAYVERIGSLLRSCRYDVVWLEKELLPMFPAWIERRLLKRCVPYIVDYDDATFHSYDLHKSRWVRCLLGTKIDKIMRSASVVLVGNDYLASRAVRVGAGRVAIVPTVVDLDRYRYAVNNDVPTVLTVGWIGSPSTAKYLELVSSALGTLSCRYAVKLLVVGAHGVRFPGVDVECCSWSEASEPELIRRMDVGIMPLVDSPWERGKCGYKLIQYMAMGKPVVASSVGMNREVVEHGVNGYLADTHEEWIAALQLIASDRRAAQLGGAAGRKKVEAKYCLRVTAPRIYDIIRAAASSCVRSGQACETCGQREM